MIVVSAPHAVAVPDLTATVTASGTQATLAAISSTAAGSGGDGTYAYSWTIVSAPAGSAASLSGAATATASLTPDKAGTWVFRCEVSSGSQVAFVTRAQIVASPLTLALTASGSQANLSAIISIGTPGGGLGAISHQHTLIRPDASSATFSGDTTSTSSVTPDVPGTYTIVDVVTDAAGQTARAERVVEVVSALSISLSATAGTQDNLNAVSTTITVVGGLGAVGLESTLTPPTGGTTTVSGSTTTTPSFTPNKAGGWRLTVVATDAAGQTATASRYLEVGTVALTVSIAAISNQVSATGTISLDSTVTNALGTLTYSWSGRAPDDTALSFADSTAADTTTTLSALMAPGEYYAVVTVTDSARAQPARATVTWRVGDAAGRAIVYDTGDLSAQADTAVAGGVSLDIAGKTWTVLNNATGTIEIDQGSGLEMTAAAGTIGLASYTSPAVYILLSSLWADYNPLLHNIAIVIHVAVDGIALTTDAYFLMLSASGANRVGSAGTSDRGFGQTRINAAGNERSQVIVATGGNPAVNRDAATNSIDLRAMRIERRGLKDFSAYYTATAADAADLSAASWARWGDQSYGIEDEAESLAGTEEVHIGVSTTAAIVITRLQIWRF